MILADKIILQRKKNGWSQEELAERLEVSRQSVSKWEGAQSVPDLQKILKMGELFGVTTDYLLKDEISEEEFGEDIKEGNAESRTVIVSMEEANGFLAENEKAAVRYALGVAMCIISPVCLFNFGVRSETIGVSIGMIVLLLLVAAAVGIFISNSRKMEKYGFLDEKDIETAYGVSGMVKERRNGYNSSHTRDLIAGVILCIMGTAVLFLPAAKEENDLIIAFCVGVLLIFEAAGVFLLVRTGLILDGFNMLLEEGNFARSRKRDKTLKAAVSAYWLTATAIYLIISFVSGDWHITWVIFAAAGVLFPALKRIMGAVRNKK
ncbi:MAG: helix-turn-helix domain-containing protein [Ruminococcus sp.]|nr:helix-turn-helix domain-containing protein [Ruminococcus sp.]